MRTLARILRNTALTVSAVVAASGILLTSAVGAVLAIDGVATVSVNTTQHLAGVAQPEPVDPTISYGYADGDPLHCARWGQRTGVITVSGTQTTDYTGCVNPAGLGLGDSFANGVLITLLNAAR